jgi:hypothetical protein
MIVSGRTITKRKKPPQQSELLFAEARYIGDCLGSSQDREQARCESGCAFMVGDLIRLVGRHKLA